MNQKSLKHQHQLGSQMKLTHELPMNIERRLTKEEENRLIDIVKTWYQPNWPSILYDRGVGEHVWDWLPTQGGSSEFDKTNRMSYHYPNQSGHFEKWDIAKFVKQQGYHDISMLITSVNPRTTGAGVENPEDRWHKLQVALGEIGHKDYERGRQVFQFLINVKIIVPDIKHPYA
jgi:hypothetical protein